MFKWYAPIVITARLFWRQHLKMSIGQFFDLCLTLTHKHTLKQTNADVDIVTHLGPVVSSLVWFLISHLSFRRKSRVSNTPLHNHSYVYRTLFRHGLDQGHCTLVQVRVQSLQLMVFVMKLSLTHTAEQNQIILTTGKYLWAEKSNSGSTWECRHLAF